MTVPSTELSDGKTIDGDLVIYKTNEIIDHLEISGYHVKGNVIVKLINCTSSSKGAPLIDFTDTWTEGDIFFEWFGPGSIRVRVFLNPIVYGNISILIHDVYTLDPDNGVHVEIYDNGENIQDSSKNQAVGNIYVNLINNFCMPMEIAVTHNWVHSIIKVEVKPGNQVNTCTLGVNENHVGDSIEVAFESNDVDRILTVNIMDNTIGEYMNIFIRSNPHLGWQEVSCPCAVYIEISNNHCVEKNTGSQVWINANTQYGIPFYTTIKENGFGGDLDIFIMGNLNLIGAGDMTNKFEKNKCDQLMSITVQGNAGYQVKDYATDNKASDAQPAILLQNPVQETGNIQENQQTVGGDSDSDGLTDAYETMIGTDPNDNDTDNDGFLDGWNDVNGNHAWDAGSGTFWDPPEKYGEIGDPLQEVEVSKHRGSIGTLFAGDDDIPNPINKDIYVEIDFLEGCVISPDLLQSVQTIFAKHCIRLHIDMGWSPGPAGGATGGNVIAGGWMHNGRNYLFLDTIIPPRRLFRPLPWLTNDFYDFKTGLTTLRPSEYFNGGKIGAREDIFHYVLFVHYYACRRNRTQPFLIDYRDNACGRGELGREPSQGDDFLVCYDNHIEGGHLNVTNLRDTFMHELGHNLELLHSWQGGTPPDGFDPDPAVNPWPGRENLSDTVMYWTGGAKLDYLRAEWARIDLTVVNDGTRLFFS